MARLVRVLLLPAILILGFAAPATPQWGSPDDGTQYLYVPPDWDQLGGGGANVTSCDAYRQFGGYCMDCTIPFAPRPGQATGPSCNRAEYSASCNCDSGKCSSGTNGMVSGSCTYHQ